MDWALAGADGFGIYPLLHFMAFVNIWWSLINLLPVRPLDGGNVASDLFGVPAARRISLVAAAGLAVFAFANGQDYAGFFAILLGVMNFLEIRGESRGSGPVEAFHVEAPDPGDKPAGRRRSRSRAELAPRCRRSHPRSRREPTARRPSLARGPRCATDVRRRHCPRWSRSRTRRRP